MMKNIQNITIGKQSISGRLEYLRQQIEECEKDIPEDFWCKKCKEKNKKVNYLEKVAVEIENQPMPDFSNCFGYGNVYGSPKFICKECRTLYYSKDLMSDVDKCNCGGTLIKIEINGNTQ